MAPPFCRVGPIASATGIGKAETARITRACWLSVDTPSVVFLPVLFALTGFRGSICTWKLTADTRLRCSAHWQGVALFLQPTDRPIHLRGNNLVQLQKLVRALLMRRNDVGAHRQSEQPGVGLWPLGFPSKDVPLYSRIALLGRRLYGRFVLCVRLIKSTHSV